jgi:large subunit ribosomal protein L28
VSRRCMLTGAEPRFGKQVSHSHRRSSRRFDPNIQTKRYHVPSLGRTVKLDLSTKAIKTIDRRGIDAVVAELRSKGVKL